jgi:hypothetical protein
MSAVSIVYVGRSPMAGFVIVVTGCIAQFLFECAQLHFSTAAMSVRETGVAGVRTLKLAISAINVVVGLASSWTFAIVSAADLCWHVRLVCMRMEGA